MVMQDTQRKNRTTRSGDGDTHCWSSTSTIACVKKLRITEIEELRVHDFLNLPNDIVAADILRCLSITERALAKSMHVVQVKGKSTQGIRKVHMVITPDAKNTADKRLAALLTRPLKSIDFLGETYTISFTVKVPFI